MRADETYYFECLRCGAQSEMINSAPRCPKCNSGTGIVHERELPEPLPVTPDPVALAMTV